MSELKNGGITIPIPVKRHTPLNRRKLICSAASQALLSTINFKMALAKSLFYFFSNHSKNGPKKTGDRTKLNPTNA
ncbi:hypothetical protein [Iodobacter ciconiae]|uniref:hypothetical protein n=1 Tax=Iodobacter ciconiae TaxID=2496266 RepID=UPI0013E0902E|nr:hypothetical protein [Iodobacter ciconiae]